MDVPASPPLTTTSPSVEPKDAIVLFQEEKTRQFVLLKKAKNKFFKLLDADENEEISFDILTRVGLERFCNEAGAPLVWTDFATLHKPPDRCASHQESVIETRQCSLFLMSLETDELQNCPLRDILSTFNSCHGSYRIQREPSFLGQVLLALFGKAIWTGSLKR
jgi:hypothetical protein